MCNVYVAVRLIQLHPEFITDIFILSCPGQVITFASANRHASASACFGHNATALLPHCANTSARRLTAPALTNIGEPALNQEALDLLDLLFVLAFQMNVVIYLGLIE